MNASKFRELALGQPDATEGSHMGHADFRVRGKIFATLSEDESSGVVNLTPELQDSFVERFPEQFVPVNGAWGMRGWTRVMLARARIGPVREAIAAAFAKVSGSGRRRSRGAAALPVKKRTAAKASKPPEHDDPAAVDALLAAMDHPLKPVVEVIRRAILGADRAITEGIKWNSPSFYLSGWFATVNVRGKQGVLVVLHHGAKVRASAALRDTIKDDGDLLHWHSVDRASVAFASAKDFADTRRAFIAIIKQWAGAQRELAAGA